MCLNLWRQQICPKHLLCQKCNRRATHVSVSVHNALKISVDCEDEVHHILL